MTLTYKFNPEDDYGFEKDIDRSDIKKYLGTLSEAEQAELVQTAFEAFTKEDQHEILAYFDEPNYACPEFSRWITDDFDYCSDLILEVEELLEGELHDYFEDEARAEWEYAEKYKDPDDPYESRGLTYDDFK